MLLARSIQPNGLVRLLPKRVKVVAAAEAVSRSEPWNDTAASRHAGWPVSLPKFWTEVGPKPPLDQGLSQAAPTLNELLYLVACQMEWEKESNTSGAWEVLSAARSWSNGLRAHAQALLEHSEGMQQKTFEETPAESEHPHNSAMEGGMRTPYGLDLIESCMGCKASREGFFCRFSTPVMRAADRVSHHTIMPAGAVLFVEGQTSRGIFILCSGKVKLSTTSRDGKVLILKQAEAGEVLGLSAAISGTNYEMTAETASACQLNYIGRADFMKLLQNESEVGVHAALWLSREFQGAYRDIHDLVLARSSSGKLARLLLSCARPGLKQSQEMHLRFTMTHEEMAQRIGSSRETVTRLLSDLKKKRLIRLDGANLVIRDRIGLEALAV